MNGKNVHTEHCCKEHGCKYGDKLCPVVDGTQKQSYPCEDCKPVVASASIEDHKFLDKDIDGVLISPTTVELGFPEGTLAIVLNKDDVKALAIHFGLL